MDLIEHFGSQPKFHVLAGAGVSVEAGLPTWPQLAERLLRAVAQERDLFSDLKVEGDTAEERASEVQALRDQWVRGTLRTESALGAIAVADAFSSEGAVAHLPRVLYAAGPDEYTPGPIARAIADLKADLERNLRIYTTNYDDLLEAALEQNEVVQGRGLPVVTYVGYDEPSEEHLKVRHMHGVRARDGTEAGTVVLTDRQYHVMREDRYPYNEFGSDLLKNDFLIVGASLNDPNVTRFLYRQQAQLPPDPPAQPREHHVVFVRQAEAYEQPTEVRAARERAVQDRWGAAGIKAIFVDHFVDVAQLLAEIRHYRRMRGRPTDTYQPLTTRMGAMIERLEREVIHSHDREEFRANQPALVEALSATLAAGSFALGLEGVELEEPLTAGLWLFDRCGRELTLWANTERHNLYPDLLQTVDLDSHRGMVVVQAACGGLGVGDERERVESRWPYIRGFPLTLTSDPTGSLPVGVVTITAAKLAADSDFARLPRRLAEVFDAAAAQSLANSLSRQLRQRFIPHTRIRLPEPDA